MVANRYQTTCYLYGVAVAAYQPLRNLIVHLLYLLRRHSPNTSGSHGATTSRSKRMHGSGINGTKPARSFCYREVRIGFIHDGGLSDKRYPERRVVLPVRGDSLCQHASKTP